MSDYRAGGRAAQYALRATERNPRLMLAGTASLILMAIPRMR